MSRTILTRRKCSVFHHYEGEKFNAFPKGGCSCDGGWVEEWLSLNEIMSEGL